MLLFFEWLPCFSVVWPKEDNHVSTVLKHIRCFQSLSTHEILVQRCNLQSNIWRSRTNYLPGVSFHFDHSEGVQDLNAWHIHCLLLLPMLLFCGSSISKSLNLLCCYDVLHDKSVLKVCIFCSLYVAGDWLTVWPKELVSIECLLCCICYAVCSRHMWIQRHKLFFLLPDH